MILQWLAHACFFIQNEKGRVLVTDPYTESIGYPVPKEIKADVVTISHEHTDHNNAAIVTGGPLVIRTAGTQEAFGFRVTGIASDHDEQGGQMRGSNVIYVIETEGLRICHCGDLGRMLTEEEKAQIGHVDILMVPIGGVYTIDAAGARQVVAALNPKVVIPMHYRTDIAGDELDGPEAFLEYMTQDEYAVSMHHAKTQEYTAADFPKRYKVLVMEPTCGKE